MIGVLFAISASLLTIIAMMVVWQGGIGVVEVPQKWVLVVATLLLGVGGIAHIINQMMGGEWGLVAALAFWSTLASMCMVTAWIGAMALHEMEKELFE